MAKLDMVHVQFTKPAPGNSTWRIGTDDKTPLTFPGDHRLQELWRRHAPGPNTDFKLHRRWDTCIAVEIATGTNPLVRQSFLDALTKEVVFA